MDESDSRVGLVFPREVALAYLDGRQTLAWLVAPLEACVTAGAGGTSKERTELPFPGPGRGLSPNLVAEELAQAVRGHRVLSANHQRVRQWIRILYETATSKPPPFVVGDLFEHARDLAPLPAESRDASAAANRIVVGIERAATEAARNATFVTALAIRLDVRDREPGGSAATPSKEDVSPGRRRGRSA